MILAADENNVIGHGNQLIWHLPADLKYFKKLTMGHHIIMGRKTFDSIGKALPGRTSVVITRNKAWEHQDVTVAHSLSDAIDICADEDEAFIIGGAQIYKIGLEIADKIYLTRVHHEFEGDTVFDGIDEAKWEMVSEEKHSSDEKNKYDYSFQVYERIFD